MSESQGEGEAGILLEADKRFSESMLWRLQRRFFEQRGEEAWSQAIVPHYITSNPFIGAAYASIVAAFLRDCRSAAGTADFGPMDPSQPVYIIELGAGPGRFAFFFLRRLLELQRRQGAAAVPFRYVLTDLADKNVAAWRAHPSLRPFVEEGVLDFARFDAENDRSVSLVESGQVLSVGSVKNPMVFIANYFFDGLPHDAFWIEAGQIHEARVSVTVPGAEPDLDDPTMLSRATLTWNHHAVPAGSYYGDAELDALLEMYRQRPGNTTVAFPVTGLRCCRALRELSGGRMLLLSADKGFISEEDLANETEPALTLHGSFSMSVNYHALAESFRAMGGQVLQTRHRPDHLCVAGFLLGQPPNAYAETRYAYEDQVERFGPDEYFLLAMAMERDFEVLTYPQILAILRLGRGDPRLMGNVLPGLIERVPQLTETEQEELMLVIEQVWAEYFHIGDEQDMPFNLGLLLYAMERYPEALVFFEHSEAFYGPNPHIVFNKGICHYQLEEWEEAKRYCERTLEIQPGHEGAIAMLEELKELSAPEESPVTPDAGP